MGVIRHVVIRGRVQGVGYRAWVEHVALRRGLQGWARNRRDGTVEAVFSGSEDAVARMVEACHVGPHSARVESVAASDGDMELLDLRRPGELFSLLPTV